MAMYHGIYLNGDALERIAVELRTRIIDIYNCYKSIENKIETLSGANDIWQGREQIKFYNALKLISNKYEDNIKKLTEIYNFLLKLIELYREKDKQFGKKMDDNSDNFNM